MAHIQNADFDGGLCDAMSESDPRPFPVLDPASVEPRLAAAYALRGETERAAAELTEARRLDGGDLFSSIARLKAFPGAWLGVPKIRALYEATYFTGSAKSGDAGGVRCPLSPRLPDGLPAGAIGRAVDPIIKPRHILQGIGLATIPPHWDPTLMALAPQACEGGGAVRPYVPPVGHSIDIYSYHPSGSVRTLEGRLNALDASGVFRGCCAPSPNRDAEPKPEVRKPRCFNSLGTQLDISNE
jgi:hypothetical protein